MAQPHSPSWRYAVEVYEGSGSWSWWSGSNSGAGAVASAKRYARDPDRDVRVREEATGRIVWSTIEPRKNPAAPAGPALSPHQKAALRRLWRETQEGRRRYPDPSVWLAYGIGSVDARDKWMGFRTLVTLARKMGSRTVREAFGRGNRREKPFLDVLARLTPAGEALARSLG